MEVNMIENLWHLYLYTCSFRGGVLTDIIMHKMIFFKEKNEI